jgi:hypothetical protein
MELVSKPEIIKVLLPALFKTLQGQSRIASNSCWTISRLVKATYSLAFDQEDDASGEPDTFVLSDHYENTIEVLIDASKR